MNTVKLILSVLNRGLILMEMKLSFYLYQILGVGIIWIGMTIFLDKIDDTGMIIYYVVTSWFLFLIVLAVKKYLRDRQNKSEED